MNRPGVALALAAAVATAACGGSDGAGPVSPSPISSESSTLTPDLNTYTDRGDGCPQVVSAVGYADQVLRPRGQESRQTFDDSVRSRLSAVGGTIALELDDFPAAAVRRQASVVQPLAERAGALIDENDAAAVKDRLRTLRRYRAEAARLVGTCAAATTKLPSSPATEGPTSP